MNELDEIKGMLEKHIADSNSRHTETAKTLARLDVAVIGDEEIGTEGLVKRVKKLESKEEQRHNRELKIAGGLTVIWFALVSAWEYVRAHWFK